MISKLRACIQCVDLRTGREGCFLDQGDKQSVSPVFQHLPSLYLWMREEGLELVPGEISAVQPIADFDPTVLIERLVDRHKLRLGHLVKALARRNTIEDVAAIERARNDYALGSDDTIEVDLQTVTSVGDDGRWVMAWVWVPNQT